MPPPDPTLIRPAVGKYEGREVTGRTLGVVVSQGQAATVEVVAREPGTGDPVDLTQYEPAGSSSSVGSSAAPAGAVTVRVRVLEAALPPAVPPVEPVAVVHDAAAGLIRFQLASPVTDVPGVYLAEIGFFAAAGPLLFSNRLFAVVERGMWGPAGVTPGGPYTTEEIRLALRDSAPEDSYLFDAREWDAAELAQAILRPVQWWNETQPPVGQKYTTQTFPYREQWLVGIQSVLYEQAAFTYRREQVAYSAAGVSLNDKAKAPEFEAKAAQLQKDFRTWAKGKKCQLNAEAAFGGVGLYLERRGW